MTRAAGIRYEITVAGHLDTHWSSRLGGLDIVHRDDGTTVLSGTLADQAELHGVLGGVRDIGVDLLGVRTVGPDAAGRGPASSSRADAGRQSAGRAEMASAQWLPDRAAGPTRPAS